MKLFVVVGILLGLYALALMHTTDIVLNQAQHLNATYQYVADHPEQVATGR